MQPATDPTPLPPLSASQIEDLKLASGKMLGAERRSFMAAMADKHCGGNARQAERVFGWGRDTVQLGLHERRTGVVCLGAQPAFCGNLPWEEKHPEVASALFALAESHAQQDPTFRTALAFTRLTAAEALRQLRLQGFGDGQLPAPSTMAQLPAVLVDQPERGVLFRAAHVVVGGAVVAPGLPAPRIVADVDAGLAVHAQTLDRPAVGRLPVLCLEVGEDRVGRGDFFWGLALTTLRRR